MNEIWKPVYGDNRYEVSNQGRLRSYCYRRTPQYIALSDRNGYKVCKIGQTPRMVHALVAEAFFGPRPHGLQCAHLNGNPSDNRLCNLKWVTPSENQQHRRMHGNDNSGERNGRCKLKEADVINIRLLHSKGASSKELAKTYNVAFGTIHSIVKGRTWKYLL